MALTTSGAAGIAVWAILSVPFFGLLGFFLKRANTWSIKPRTPSLVVAAGLFAYGVETIQVFQYAYPYTFPCTLPYFMYCTAFPAFFACYILRAYRLLEMYEFSRVKATLVKYDAVAQTMAVKSPFSIRRYPVDAIQKIIQNRAQYTETFYGKFLGFVWGTNTFLMFCVAAAVWDVGITLYCNLWVNNFTCVYVLLAFWASAFAMAWLCYTLKSVDEGYRMKQELLLVTIATFVAAVPFTGAVAGGFWWPEYPYVGWIIGAYFLFVLLTSTGIPIYLSYQSAQAEPSKKDDAERPPHDLMQFLSGPGLHYFQEFLVREFAVENLMFYTEVNKFKQLTEMNDLVKSASDIFNKFLAPNAAFMINASRDDIREIQKHLNVPDAAMYDRVLNALIRDMETGTFPRFVTSDLYKAYTEGQTKFRPRVERIEITG